MWNKNIVPVKQKLNLFVPGGKSKKQKKESVKLGHKTLNGPES